MKTSLVIVCALLLLDPLLVGPALAGPVTGTKQSTRLYTRSDPNAAGGIHARIDAPDQGVQQAFAINNGNPELVYYGTVSGDGREIRFAGLPPAIYDLMLVASDRFYEGIRLARDPDTLTGRDRQLIREAIGKSVPFFDTKEIHRCEGMTGRSGKARCVLQEVRTRPVTLQSGEVRTDIQVRSIKLAFLEDVGEVGWQLVQTREIVRTETGPDDRKGILPHCHLSALGKIRVVTAVKDLGALPLNSGSSPPAK